MSKHYDDYRLGQRSRDKEIAKLKAEIEELRHVYEIALIKIQNMQLANGRPNERN